VHRVVQPSPVSPRLPVGSRFGFLAFLCCLALPALGAQEEAAGAFTVPEGNKHIVVPRLQQAPRIDGVLDDAVWEQAVLVRDFHQMEPIEYAPPSQQTEVRVFYTDDALYVSARLYEKDPSQISANIMRQGQSLLADDIFVLMLDPFLDRRNGYEFETNANGVRRQGMFQNVTEIDRNWTNVIWQTRSRIDELGWTVEIMIPFQTISFNPDSDTWGINFRRAVRRNNENIAWVSRNRQMNPSIAGTASGFTGLRQGIGLDVVPYLLLRQERLFGPGDARDSSMEPQLDLFYKITPQLNAALTLNTDFSATEVDDRQVNLSRFNLFFPERRDFFTRDADIFEFGQIGSGGFARGTAVAGNPAVPSSAAQNGRPFFSRRIGLSANGAPVDLDAGIKLSGRAGDWNLGSILVSQGEDEASGLDSTSVFVGRAALNVLAESQIGMIMTHGDPQSNQDNSLLGADFRYYNSRLGRGRVVQGGLWYQQSDTKGFEGQDAAYGFNVGSPNNNGWRGNYSFKRVERNFRPALGFVNQVDMQDHALDVGYRRFNAPGGFVRATYVGFDGYRSEEIRSRDPISQNVGLRFIADNNTGDYVTLRAIRNRELLREDFTIYRASDALRRVVIPAGDYQFDELVVSLQSAEQRDLLGNVSVRGGDYYDGTRLQRQAGLTWRPLPGYQFSASYTEDEIHLLHGNFTVRQTTLSSQISFSSMLTWSNLIQYDNVSELIGFNSRLHWIPEAGKQVFLVLNYGLADYDKDNNFESVNWDLSLKFSYTLRF